MLIYQSIFYSSDKIWARHHSRVTRYKTVSSACLHKLSIAISKNLHSIPKIDSASEFTCSSKLFALLKPHAVLRLLKALSVHQISQLWSISFQWSHGRHLTKRDRWTEKESACHQSTRKPSQVATNQQRACWGCSPGEASSYFPISVTREKNRNFSQHSGEREWKQDKRNLRDEGDNIG